MPVPRKAAPPAPRALLNPLGDLVPKAAPYLAGALLGGALAYLANAPASVAIPAHVVDVDAIECAVCEERQDGEQVVPGGHQHRRQHAERKARQRDLVRRDAASGQPCGSGIDGGLHEFQGKAVKHGSPRRP